MYANRYRSGQFDPKSLSLSVGVVGGLIAAGMLLGTTVITIIERKKPPLITYTVPSPKTPPPVPKPMLPVEAKVRTPTVIEPRVPVPTQTEQPQFSAPEAGPFVDAGVLLGTGSATTIDPPKPIPTPAPVLTRADVDPRYRRDFQPIYPAAEQRAGTEGVVTLRVLIGADGRVRQVERLASPSDAFWRATEARALSKWRFNPATRDGVPYESWKTMTVRFRIADEG